MSARTVADLLALAHVGFMQAAVTADIHLLNDSKRLAVAALEHPSAGAFFAGLQVALAETYDEDDDLPDEQLPGTRDILTGGANAAAPVDAGCLPHDEKITEKDILHAESLEPRKTTAADDGMADLVRRAAARFA